MQKSWLCSIDCMYNRENTPDLALPQIWHIAFQLAQSNFVNGVRHASVELNLTISHTCVYMPTCRNLCCPCFRCCFAKPLPGTSHSCGCC